MRAALAAAALLLASAICSPALADPCEAKVTGYKPGQQIAGPVRYIVDGDGLCIGPTADPRTWLEVRLADYYAPELNEPGGPEAKDMLARLVAGREITCTVRRGDGGRTTSYDRLIAVCAYRGRPVADAMREAGLREGGNGR